MTQIVYVLGFLVFDREAGRARPATITGLAAVALVVVSHFWLSGPWLQQAGFPGVPHSRSAVSSPAPPAVHGLEGPAGGGAAVSGRPQDEVVAALGLSLPVARHR